MRHAFKRKKEKLGTAVIVKVFEKYFSVHSNAVFIPEIAVSTTIRMINVLAFSPLYVSPLLSLDYKVPYKKDDPRGLCTRDNNNNNNNIVQYATGPSCVVYYYTIIIVTVIIFLSRALCARALSSDIVRSRFPTFFFSSHSITLSLSLCHHRRRRLRIIIIIASRHTHG